jgi:NAD+ synthase
MKKENEMEAYKGITDSISSWLNEYSKQSGLGTYVVGVSGGIDSALVSTLCSLTGRPTHVFNIPIKSSQKNTALSTLHCEWLISKYKNVHIHNVDLSDTYDSFISSVVDVNENDLACANTKSRLRMVLLYHYATIVNGLVVGTGNKVEDYGVGFFTKYGDGGVDLSPIADLTKTQVRECARALGVLSDIINAPPTDGLWDDNRTDESQIGASYEELEWAMDYIDTGKYYHLSDRQKNVIDIFLRFRDKNKHKISPIPTYKIR